MQAFSFSSPSHLITYNLTEMRLLWHKTNNIAVHTNINVRGYAISNLPMLGFVGRNTECGRSHAEMPHSVRPEKTRRDGQMSRASVSCLGKLGNMDLVGSDSGQVKPMTFQIDTCPFLVWCSALL